MISAASSLIFWGLCIVLMFCVLGGMFCSGMIASLFISEEEIIEGQSEYERSKKRNVL